MKPYNDKNSENNFLDPSLYPVLQLKLTGSVLGGDPSYIQVYYCLCNPADKPTNTQTDTSKNVNSLAEVIKVIM